jgi:hypothetical protein
MCISFFVDAKLPSYQAQIMATFHAQQDGPFALTALLQQQ